MEARLRVEAVLGHSTWRPNFWRACWMMERGHADVDTFGRGAYDTKIVGSR